MDDEFFDLNTDNELRFVDLLKTVSEIAPRVAAEFDFPEYCIGFYKKENKSGTVYPIEVRELRRNFVDQGGTIKKADSKKIENAEDGEEEVEVERVTEELVDGIRLRFTCNRFATLCLPKARSKYNGFVMFKLNSLLLAAVRPPARAILLEHIRKIYKRDQEGNLVFDKDGRKIVIDEIVEKRNAYIPLDGKDAVDYLEDLIRYKLRTFQSKEPMYGCCHLYVECSDACRCLSKDKMYATACSYRRNLESGRIFYGKNKNV